MADKKKPIVVITRKLPDAIETRMMELFDTRLNETDKPLSPAQLVQAMQTADVLVPTVTRPHRCAHSGTGRAAVAPDRLVRHRG